MNVERLVRLQRKVDELKKLVFKNPWRVDARLAALHEEIDSIILGEPSEEDVNRQARRARGMP